jgi:hypothetical protein
MAATTITAVYPPTSNVTPFAAIFAVAGDDDTSPGTLDRTGTLTGCASGPLKTLLANTSDWTVFNLGGTQCGKVHVRNIPVSEKTIQVADFVWTANGLKAAVQGTGPGAAQVFFEVRLSHSNRF